MTTNLRSHYRAYNEAKSALDQAYAALHEIKTAHAEEVKKQIQELMDRCGAAAAVLQDLYNERK